MFSYFETRKQNKTTQKLGKCDNTITIMQKGVT